MPFNQPSLYMVEIDQSRYINKKFNTSGNDISVWYKTAIKQSLFVVKCFDFGC